MDNQDTNIPKKLERALAPLMNSEIETTTQSTIEEIEAVMVACIRDIVAMRNESKPISTDSGMWYR